MDRTTFTILGTSSGVPQAGAVCSGYVLEGGSKLTLFDCGGGVTSAFLSAGFDFRDVERIIISHSHSDHVCELSLFLQGMYLARKEGTVDLYLPEEFVSVFKQYLTAVYLFPVRFNFALSIIGYTGSLEIDGKTRISGFANSHLQKYQPFVEKAGGGNMMQSHSFVIQSPNKRLLYSADIGSFDDIAHHLDGTDYVVTELSHVDRPTFFDVIKNYSIEKLIVTHLDGSAERAEIESLAQKVNATNMEIAYSGMRLDL